MGKQDQGSKAPSSHTSFYPCLPFYQVYLSILSFAPCTFLPSRVAKSVKRYTILKFALKILHEILHQHFFLKSQHAPLKQKIIARLKKKKKKKRFCELSHHNFFLS